ncbi:MAG: DciA family protein [Pseudomonadota bacterium]
MSMMKRRKPTAKPISELLVNVLRPSLESHGLATSQIITRWREIAGEELSNVTRPLRINWPRSAPQEGAANAQGQGATLVLLVENAFALDVQHAAPLILQRVNAIYGWSAVQKISLRQGPVRTEIIEENQVVDDDPAPHVEGIAEEGLRNALQKLGKSVRKSQKN